MTDNQRFKAFHQKVRKMRFGHHVEIPFPTKVVIHVWTDKSDAKSHKQIEFTMQPGMKAVDASKMADSLTKMQFGMTRAEMEYSATHCSHLDILCASTGKKLKV